MYMPFLEVEIKQVLIILFSGAPSVNRIDLTLAGPTGPSPVLETLAVLRLDNQLDFIYANLANFRFSLSY